MGGRSGEPHDTDGLVPRAVELLIAAVSLVTVLVLAWKPSFGPIGMFLSLGGALIVACLSRFQICVRPGPGSRARFSRLRRLTMMVALTAILLEAVAAAFAGAAHLAAGTSVALMAVVPIQWLGAGKVPDVAPRLRRTVSAAVQGADMARGSGRAQTIGLVGLAALAMALLGVIPAAAHAVDEAWGPTVRAVTRYFDPRPDATTGGSGSTGMAVAEVGEPGPDDPARGHEGDDPPGGSRGLPPADSELPRCALVGGTFETLDELAGAVFGSAEPVGTAVEGQSGARLQLFRKAPAIGQWLLLGPAGEPGLLTQSVRGHLESRGATAWATSLESIEVALGGWPGGICYPGGGGDVVPVVADGVVTTILVRPEQSGSVPTVAVPERLVDDWVDRTRVEGCVVVPTSGAGGDGQPLKSGPPLTDELARTTEPDDVRAVTLAASGAQPC